MNRFSLLILGFFFTFLTSWLGLVIAPYLQIGRLSPEQDADTKNVNPPPLSGLAEHGRLVYAANGCVYCHSQQVRGAKQGADIERGWGVRRTVSRDYINERPVFLGTMRTGPDLANIGARYRGEAGREWHMKHLYEPQSVSPYSIMPNFRFLFKVQKIEGSGSANAVKFINSDFKPNIPSGYEILPTYDAEALVAYLLELKRDYALKEAPTD